MTNTSEVNDMMNIVVPMAGRGSRFANAGFTDPSRSSASAGSR
jgi:hypothetical protein